MFCVDSIDTRSYFFFRRECLRVFIFIFLSYLDFGDCVDFREC